jgi:asparagine synthase (glutamine-hydrolysing)
MCGIVGFQGTFAPDLLSDATQALTHRGPDGAGVCIRGNGASATGLGHRRLSIIDLSPLGSQPMASPGGEVVITFNGEIYNYRELRGELAAAGVRFRGHSDTEVLLHLYLAEGEAMLPRLNGIFAFGLWDGRNDSLFLVRDALGVKPLYYTQTGHGLAFASEIKALLHLVPEARTLDPPSLHRYLTYLWCPGEGTPLREVRKLLPGEALTVRGGRIEQRWSWFQLPQFKAVAGSMNAHAAIEGTIGHLRRAVQRQLVADVPVGSFLSGGLDSSAVVALAREQAPGIRCFTIESLGAQDSGFADDLPYARRVAQHLGVPLDVVTIDAGRMAEDLETMVWQLDEPLADPAPLNVLYISQLARRHGIKVLLSGTGGDDLFSGYRRHVALHYERYWRWLPHQIRYGLDRATKGMDQRHALLRRIGKLFNGAGLDGNARMANYFHWTRESELLALYTPAFREAISAEPVDRPMLDALRALPRGTDALSQMLVLEQQFFLPDLNLTYTDKMSMAAGVEVRVPFLDPDLVAFAARVPEGYKQRGKVGKWVLKKAMEPFLPMDVIYRPKTGFGAPLRRWIRGELRPLVAQLLSRDSLLNRGIFDPNSVDQLIHRNQRGEVDAAYLLLSLMSIEIWCRKFIDAPTMKADFAVPLALQAEDQQ